MLVRVVCGCVGLIGFEWGWGLSVWLRIRVSGAWGVWPLPPFFGGGCLGLFWGLFCCLAGFCGCFGCCFGTE